MVTKQEAADAVRAAKVRLGMSWARASDKVVVAVQVVFSGLWRVRGRRAFPFLYGVWVCPFPGGAGSRVRGLVTVREGFCAGLVTVRPGGVSLRAGQRGPG